MRINFSIEGTNYSIDADSTQYTLIRHGVNQAKGDNFGKLTEQQIGYFSQVKNAVNKAITDHLGSQPDEITLKEFLDRYELANESVMAQIGDK